MAAVVALKAAPGFAVAPSLYEVVVEVENRSALVRQAASREGLARVLTRVSGLASLPAGTVLETAFSQPERYYNRYLFEDGRHLKFFFAPDAILGLIDQAKLPVWPFNRPKTIAWVVVEQDGVREIVQDGQPLALALVEQARHRGLEVRLPLMDLRDQTRVQPATVWGGSMLLVAASRRYGADVALVARLWRRADSAYSGRFLAWMKGAEFEADAAAAPMADMGVAAADFLADFLAGRQAVPWRVPQRLPLVIDGISSPLHYGALLRYLDAVELVGAVEVVALDQERLEVAVNTRADTRELVELLEADGQLAANVAGGFPNYLTWRGR